MIAPLDSFVVSYLQEQFADSSVQVFFEPFDENVSTESSVLVAQDAPVPNTEVFGSSVRYYDVDLSVTVQTPELTSAITNPIDSLLQLETFENYPDSVLEIIQTDGDLEKLTPTGPWVRAWDFNFKIFPQKG